jgi:hypothetical protein
VADPIHDQSMGHQLIEDNAAEHCRLFFLVRLDPIKPAHALTDAAKVDHNLKGATQEVQQFYSHSKKYATIARNKVNNVICDLDHCIQVRGAGLQFEEHRC